MSHGEELNEYELDEKLLIGWQAVFAGTSAETGNLEILPAQKLSILTSAHQEQGRPS